MKIDNANPRSPFELVFILDDYGRNARGRQSSRSRAKDLQAKDSTVLQFMIFGTCWFAFWLACQSSMGSDLMRLCAADSNPSKL